MIFKRRDRRSLWQILKSAFWPKGGWGRAFSYVTHRLRRLPDPPHRIARGIWAGVLASFTPFFGFHFVTAGALAWILRGNIIAALLATFFGNPITFPIIATLSLRLGNWMLGTKMRPGDHKGVLGNFSDASKEIIDNVVAIFTPAHTEWGRLTTFFTDIFLPYLVGGIVPGIVAATACYYLSLPLLVAYQNRRKGRLAERLAKLRRKKVPRADPGKDLP